MSSSLPGMMPPLTQFFTNTGTFAPLSGGKIYFAQPGTTAGPGSLTLKDTYTSITAQTANANPVVLDSQGRANIWLSGYYSVAVYDSLGNLIKTEDNVSASGADVGGSNPVFIDTTSGNVTVDLAGYTEYSAIKTDGSGNKVLLIDSSGKNFVNNSTSHVIGSKGGFSHVYLHGSIWYYTDSLSPFVGDFLRPAFTFLTSSSISISTGAYHHAGTIDQLVNIVTPFNYSLTGLSGTTWNYIYLSNSSISAGGSNIISSGQIANSSTAPTWNNSKNGWYKDNDRCIFSVYIQGGNITEFFHYDNFVLFADDIALSNITSATFADEQTICPAFTTKVLLTFYAAQENSFSTLYWRTNGQTGSTGHLVTDNYDTLQNMSDFNYNTTPVITDANGIIECKVAGGNVNVKQQGIYLGRMI